MRHQQQQQQSQRPWPEQHLKPRFVVQFSLIDHQHQHQYMRVENRTKCAKNRLESQWVALLFYITHTRQRECTGRPVAAKRGTAKCLIRFQFDLMRTLRQSYIKLYLLAYHCSTTSCGFFFIMYFFLFLHRLHKKCWQRRCRCHCAASIAL